VSAMSALAARARISRRIRLSRTRSANAACREQRTLAANGPPAGHPRSWSPRADWSRATDGRQMGVAALAADRLIDRPRRHALGRRALSGPALLVRKLASTSEGQARSRVRLPELASACRTAAR